MLRLRHALSRSRTTNSSGVQTDTRTRTQTAASIVSGNGVTVVSAVAHSYHASVARCSSLSSAQSSSSLQRRCVRGMSTHAAAAAATQPSNRKHKRRDGTSSIQATHSSHQFPTKSSSTSTSTLFRPRSSFLVSGRRHTYEAHPAYRNSPVLAAYIDSMQSSLHDGAHAEAIEVFEKMKNDRRVQTLHVEAFNLLIEACAAMKQPEAAIAAFDAIYDHELQPDFFTYLAVIEALKYHADVALLSDFFRLLHLEMDGAFRLRRQELEKEHQAILKMNNTKKTKAKWRPSYDSCETFMLDMLNSRVYPHLLERFGRHVAQGYSGSSFVSFNVRMMEQNICRRMMDNVRRIEAIMERKTKRDKEGKILSYPPLTYMSLYRTALHSFLSLMRHRIARNDLRATSYYYDALRAFRSRDFNRLFAAHEWTLGEASSTIQFQSSLLTTIVRIQTRLKTLEQDVPNDDPIGSAQLGIHRDEYLCDLLDDQHRSSLPPNRSIAEWQVLFEAYYVRFWNYLQKLVLIHASSTSDSTSVHGGINVMEFTEKSPLGAALKHALKKSNVELLMRIHARATIINKGKTETQTNKDKNEEIDATSKVQSQPTPSSNSSSLASASSAPVSSSTPSASPAVSSDGHYPIDEEIERLAKESAKLNSEIKNQQDVEQEIEREVEEDEQVLQTIEEGAAAGDGAPLDGVSRKGVDETLLVDAARSDPTLAAQLGLNLPSSSPSSSSPSSSTSSYRSNIDDITHDSARQELAKLIEQEIELANKRKHEAILDPIPNSSTLLDEMSEGLHSTTKTQTRRRGNKHQRSQSLNGAPLLPTEHNSPLFKALTSRAVSSLQNLYRTLMAHLLLYGGVSNSGVITSTSFRRNRELIHALYHDYLSLEVPTIDVRCLMLAHLNVAPLEFHATLTSTHSESSGGSAGGSWSSPSSACSTTSSFGRGLFDALFGGEFRSRPEKRVHRIWKAAVDCGTLSQPIRSKTVLAGSMNTLVEERTTYFQRVWNAHHVEHGFGFDDSNIEQEAMKTDSNNATGSMSGLSDLAFRRRTLRLIELMQARGVPLQHSRYPILPLLIRSLTFTSFASRKKEEIRALIDVRRRELNAQKHLRRAQHRVRSEATKLKHRRRGVLRFYMADTLEKEKEKQPKMDMLAAMDAAIQEDEAENELQPSEPGASSTSPTVGTKLRSSRVIHSNRDRQRLRWHYEELRQSRIGQDHQRDRQTEEALAMVMDRTFTSKTTKDGSRNNNQARTSNASAPARDAQYALYIQRRKAARQRKQVERWSRLKAMSLKADQARPGIMKSLLRRSHPISRIMLPDEEHLVDTAPSPHLARRSWQHRTTWLMKYEAGHLSSRKATRFLTRQQFLAKRRWYAFKQQIQRKKWEKKRDMTPAMAQEIHDKITRKKIKWVERKKKQYEEISNTPIWSLPYELRQKLFHPAQLVLLRQVLKLLLSWMRESGIRVDVGTMNELLSACMFHRSWSEAHAVLHHMRHTFHLTPDQTTMQILMAHKTAQAGEQGGYKHMETIEGQLNDIIHAEGVDGNRFNAQSHRATAERQKFAQPSSHANPPHPAPAPTPSQLQLLSSFNDLLASYRLASNDPVSDMMRIHERMFELGLRPTSRTLSLSLSILLQPSKSGFGSGSGSVASTRTKLARCMELMDHALSRHPKPMNPRGALRRLIEEVDSNRSKRIQEESRIQNEEAERLKQIAKNRTRYLAERDASEARIRQHVRQIQQQLKNRVVEAAEQQQQIGSGSGNVPLEAEVVKIMDTHVETRILGAGRPLLSSSTPSSASTLPKTASSGNDLFDAESVEASFMQPSSTAAVPNSSVASATGVDPSSPVVTSSASSASSSSIVNLRAPSSAPVSLSSSNSVSTFPLLFSYESWYGVDVSSKSWLYLIQAAECLPGPGSHVVTLGNGSGNTPMQVGNFVESWKIFRQMLQHLSDLSSSDPTTHADPRSNLFVDKSRWEILRTLLRATALYTTHYPEAERLWIFKAVMDQIKDFYTVSYETTPAPASNSGSSTSSQHSRATVRRLFHYIDLQHPELKLAPHIHAELLHLQSRLHKLQQQHEQGDAETGLSAEDLHPPADIDPEHQSYIPSAFARRMKAEKQLKEQPPAVKEKPKMRRTPSQAQQMKYDHAQPLKQVHSSAASSLDFL